MDPSADELGKFLKGVPMFSGLSEATLDGLAAIVRPRSLDAGQRLFYSGQECFGFFAVRRGVILLYRTSTDGRRHTVNHVTAGRTFAEAAVLQYGRYPVSAEGLASVNELVVIPSEPFNRLLQEDAALVPAVVSALCARLHTLVERIEDLSTVRSETRVARALLRLPARRADEDLVVTLETTKADFARSLAMTPETLSRLLRRWARTGVLTVERRSLILHRPEALLETADGEVA